jgi:hypothetical protein
MKNNIFKLFVDDPVRIESLIIWHYYIAGRYIASPDLLVLIEQYYFSN